MAGTGTGQGDDRPSQDHLHREGKIFNPDTKTKQIPAATKPAGFWFNYGSNITETVSEKELATYILLVFGLTDSA